MNPLHLTIFLAIAIVNIAVLVFALMRLRKLSPQDHAPILERFSALDTKLSDNFTKATADMAGRVEQVKGDLRTDLADRLQQGITNVRETVDKQLTDGRTEQSNRLSETVTALEQKFDGLKSATESKLETFSQKQADTLKDSRTETTNALTGLTSTLQGSFDRMIEAQAEAAKNTRVEQEQKLEGLKTSTASKLESLTQNQSGSLKECRTELTNALGTLTTGLEQKFDKLNEGQTAAAKDARTELGGILADMTKELQTKFEGLETKTAQSLEAVRTKVDEKLQTISDQVQQKLEKNIQEGFAHFQKVQEHLKAAEEQLRNVGVVGQSINELNTLLKLPHLRGKFGEAELGRLLADFLPAAAYEEQAVIVPGSQEKVDAVIKFPNAKLPVDSKFNREQIIPLFETNDPERLKEARASLAAVIKAQAKIIGEKYIHPEHGTAELALMFVPSETIYFEVIRNGQLCEELHKLNVFPVSPNTLAITLKSIAMSFGYYEFAKNVEKTLEQIKQAQKSFGFFQKKFEEVGKGLEKAQSAYSTASGHLNRYTNRVVQLTGEPVPEINGDEQEKTLPAIVVTN